MQSMFCLRLPVVTRTALILLATISCNLLFGQFNWQTVNSSTSYDNRDEHGYVELHGKFYLIGGAYQGTPLVQEYDPATNQWTNKSSVPQDFHHLQAVAYDSLIWVICAWRGTYGSETNTTHVFSYDPLTDTWTQRTEIPLDRRRGSTGVVVYDDKFYIIGGNSGGHGSQGDVKTWVDVYDPNANGGLGLWDTLSPMPIGRDHFEAVGKDGKIFAIGGRDSGGSGNFFNTVREQVDVYDIATDVWTTLPTTSNLPTPRAGATNVLMDDDIIVLVGVGNSSTQEKDDVEAFNIITQTWRTLPPAPTKRSGTQAVPFGRKIFMASGISSVFGGTDLFTHDVLYVPPVGAVNLTVTQPSDVSATVGDSASFTVFVYNADSAVNYQWQRLNSMGVWQDVGNAKNSRFVFQNAALADDSSYFRVRVSDRTDTVFSDPALLTVGCSPVFSGNTDPIVLEAENYQEHYSRSGKSWDVTTFNGASGNILDATPNTGANYNTGYTTQSPEVQYEIDFAQTGTYYVWVRTYSPSFEDNSFHVALDSIITGTSDKMTYDTYNQWGWTRQTMDGNVSTVNVTTVGIHSLHIWVREDGVKIDRIVLTQNNNYTPSGLGPAESNFCDPLTAFPIELTDWNGKRVADQILLNWTSQSEINSAFFSVQRSSDQQLWSEIGDVDAAGFADEPQNYQFWDIQPFDGINYYRLKMVDADGRFEFSSSIAINFQSDHTTLLQAFPDPVTSQHLHIRFGHNGKQTKLSLRNLWGQTIFESVYTDVDAVLERDISLPDLPAGVYLLQAENEDFSNVVKVVVK